MQSVGMWFKRLDQTTTTDVKELHGIGIFTGEKIAAIGAIPQVSYYSILGKFSNSLVILSGSQDHFIPTVHAISQILSIGTVFCSAHSLSFVKLSGNAPGGKIKDLHMLFRSEVSCDQRIAPGTHDAAIVAIDHLSFKPGYHLT